MSPNGQLDPPPTGAVIVGHFHVPRNRWFGWHRHFNHQLAWAVSGVVIVRVRDGRNWVLPPGRALWIPAGTEHTTGASVTTELGSLYLDQPSCPIRWTEPTVVGVHGLLRELIDYLGRDDLAESPRERAEALLYDLLSPVRTTAIDLPEPVDERLCRIAELLRDDPADGRSLGDWGREVGASARNLARLWTRDTGMTFGQWRTQARLRSALALLADGLPVSRVAGRVGYATPSAFVAVFRRSVGVSPGAYFAAVS
jgi:AraC-like DNA-binding protein